MISHLNKRFFVPSEKKNRQKLIPNLNRQVQYKIKQSLDENDVAVYSITTDIWSSKGQRTFISYTIHYYINVNKRASLASAARLADTLCPPEAPFGRLGSHWLFIREITSLKRLSYCYNLYRTKKHQIYQFLKF